MFHLLLHHTFCRTRIPRYPGTESQRIRGKNSVETIKGQIELANNIYNQGQDLFQDGKELYATLQSVPALVGAMNEYEIPLLNQVKTVFQCLELINKIQNIVDGIKNAGNSFKDLGKTIEGTFDAFEDLITKDKNPSTLAKLTEGLITGEPAFSTINTINITNNNIQDNINSEQASIANQNKPEIILNNTQLNKNNCSTVIFSYSANTNDSSNPSEWTENISELDAIDLIEKLPRLTQIYNSIKETPSDLPVTLFEELTQPQIEAIKNTEINVVTNNCFLAPKLNLIESTVQVIQIKENVMLYKDRKSVV